MTHHIYKATGLPTADKTYAGSFTLSIANNPIYKGNYKMILLPEEPSTGGMEFAEAPFAVLGPSAVAFKGATARTVVPVCVLVAVLGLGLGLVLLRRRA